MRRRERKTSPAGELELPDDLAAGPVVAVWADPATLREHQAGRAEWFDPGLSARRRYLQARGAWVAAQPDLEAAYEALRTSARLRGQRLIRDPQRSLDVKQ